MSSLYGRKGLSLKDVKDFRLPLFKELDEEAPAVEFEFKPLEGAGGDPAMTVAQAKREAEEMRARALAESESLKSEAAGLKAEAADKGYEEGLARGLAQGREEGRAAFEAEAATFLEALRSVESLYQDLWSVNEAGLVKLALKVAERVLHHEAATSPELIIEAFKASLDHLHEQHQAVFRVNPEDLAFLESVESEVRDRINRLVKITFQPDPSLVRGDLVMETEAGRLDATLKQRLDAVTAALDEVLEQKFSLD